MSPSLRGVAGVLGTVVCLAVVGPVVIHAVPGLVGVEHSYVVLSGSMAPTLSPGDSVLVEDVRPADVEVGDVITYRRPGSETPTTHRVVDIRRADGTLEFRTQGDANEEPDTEWVPATHVVGETTMVFPYLGHLVLLAGSRAGLVGLVVVPFGLLAVSEVWTALGGGTGSGTGAEDTTAGGSVAGGEGAGPTATATDEAADEVVTLAPTDLRLTALVLVAFACYALWVAMGQATPVTVGVAAGVGVAALGTVVAVLALTRRGGAVGATDDPEGGVAGD